MRPLRVSLTGATPSEVCYDLNRYNDPKFTGDQTEIYRAVLAITIVK